MTTRADPDGTLLLKLPLGTPAAEYEVLVVVQPTSGSVLEGAAQRRDWPPRYFDETYGSIQDETFVRHPQGELPHPVDVD